MLNAVRRAAQSGRVEGLGVGLGEGEEMGWGVVCSVVPTPQ